VPRPDRKPSRRSPEPDLESRIYWLAVLERALERGDHARAAEARAALARLGVRVEDPEEPRP
jgi:hypothetical protein